MADRADRARRGAAGFALRVAVTVAWAVTACLAAAAIARVAAWDAWWPFIWVDALSLVSYLPAWLVLAFAAAFRRVALAVAALMVVGAQLVFVVPELTAGQAVPPWARSAPHLTLLDANVYAGNPGMRGYATLIEHRRPDLVALEEATTDHVAALERQGALSSLPYRVEVSRSDPWAFLVASRYPLRRVHVVTGGGRPLVVQATVDLPSGPLALWVLHTVAPLPGTWREWTEDLDEIVGLAAARRPRRLLVVGDFNATWGNRGFRRLLDRGFVDAAAALGDPLDMTWSQTAGPFPLIRIDHVLTRGRVAVTDITTVPGPGSDHRAVLASVAVG